MLGVWAALLVLLVVLVPGLALQRALAPRADVVVRVAASAPVGLGAVWVLTTLLHVLGRPVSPAWLLPPLAVVVLVCALAARRRPVPGAWRSPGVDRWDVAAIVVGSATILAMAWVASSGLSLAVPNDDGAIHSWMTTRIATTGSVSPDVVLSTDAYVDLPGASFYPLVLHTVAALAHQLGVPVATGLDAVWAVLVAVSLPTGMFALARTTFPSVRRLPAAAALVFGVMPLVPYDALTWGGIAYAVGIAVVPGVVALAVRSATTATGAGEALVLGVAVVGVAFSHTTEVVVAALVAGCLLLGDVRLRSTLRVRDSVRTLLVVAGVAFVVVLPWVSALRGGGSERVGLALPEKDASETFGIWVQYLFGPYLPAMAAAALVGLVVATWMRWFTGWWLVIGATTVLIAITYLEPPVLTALTLPWYGLPARVAATLVYPSGLAVAVGCWWVARALSRGVVRLRRRDAGSASTAVRVVCVGAVGAVVLGGMVVDCTQKLWAAYVGPDGPGTGASLTTPAAAAGFAELARLVPPGGRVLNEFEDGSSWMYADEGVAPLLPSKPDDIGGDRLYLLEHAADLRTDTRAAAVAREWSVGYAYVRDRRFPQYQDGEEPPRLQVDSLVAGGWTVVWQQDDVTVLRAPA